MNLIIVGYDDTDPSKRALERAALLAKTFGAKLVVTSVAPVSTTTGGRSLGADPADTASDHLAELASARSYLEGESLQAEYIEALGHPADAIVTAAEDRGADMIVVGTREAGFTARLLGSSVSDAVSHKAHCDVLIVH
jgi:nucleotide-binding universal stress UspA family protein